jgi:hypothetical protein
MLPGNDRPVLLDAVAIELGDKEVGLEGDGGHVSENIP